jgi:repressor LexA
MAERVGFEPTVRCRTAVFKTASLNHSDISPCGHSPYAVSNAYLIYQICRVLSSLSANFFRMVGKAAVTHNLFLLRLQKALYRNTFLLYNNHKKISSRCKGEYTMSFSELLKQCRKKQGISQAELASKLGVTQQAVGKWESGKSSPDPSTVARIAELLNTTADYLLGLYRPVSNVSAPEERFFGSYSESLIPVIGTVKAGYGALAFEEDYGQEYARVKDPSNYFYLVVRGDSMEPRIQDGDLALVHKQDTLENGDLGVLIYGDEGEGTLKRYIQRGNCVVLQPFNPAYNELVIKGEDLNHLHIAGRVVETKAKW